MFVDELSFDGQGQLEHKLEKMMINEFSRPWFKTEGLHQGCPCLHEKN